MFIKLRYKKPASKASKLIVQAVNNSNTPLERTSDNFRFSAAVAEFGMLLRNSAYKHKAGYDQVKRLAISAKGKDLNGYRAEFLNLVESAVLIASGTSAK